MIKNVTLLEVKKGERLYQMQVSNDSPLGEVFDALNEMRGFVYDKIKSVMDEAKKNEEVKPEESVEV